jgi:hypothetical protein
MNYNAPEAENPAPAGQECVAHEFCLDSDHALERRAAVKKAITTLEERVRVLTDALRAFPEFPRECAHDAEPDYCDCCVHEWEKAVGAWKVMRTAALNPNQPEEPK